MQRPFNAKPKKIKKKKNRRRTKPNDQMRFSSIVFVLAQNGDLCINGREWGAVALAVYLRCPLNEMDGKKWTLIRGFVDGPQLFDGLHSILYVCFCNHDYWIYWLESRIFPSLLPLLYMRPIQHLSIRFHFLRSNIC